MDEGTAMNGTTIGGSRPPGAISGSRSLPLLGSCLELPRYPLGTYQQAMGTYGDVVRSVVGPHLGRVISSPCTVHLLLRSHSVSGSKARSGHDL